MQSMAVDEYQRRRMISISPHWQWFEVFDQKYYEMLELINGSRVDGPGYVSSLVVVWFFCLVVVLVVSVLCRPFPEVPITQRVALSVYISRA